MENYNSKTKELYFQIVMDRGMEIFESKEEIDEVLRKSLEELGRIALKENRLDAATKAYIKLRDKEKVRLVGEMCLLQNEYLYHANEAFTYLKDKQGLLRVIRALAEKGELYFYENIVLENYLGKERFKKFYKDFKEWAEKQGVPKVIVPNALETANMAYNKFRDYDLGIGIARGGLFTSYIFNKFGLNVKNVQAHRNEKGATFSWISNVNPEELREKNIVVFDKDVVTGRTSQRVLTELQKFKPKKLDLILNYNPTTKGGIGSVIQNIPKGYQEIFYPNKFSNQTFNKAIQRLEEII